MIAEHGYVVKIEISEGGRSRAGGGDREDAAGFEGSNGALTETERQMAGPEYGRVSRESKRGVGAITLYGERRRRQVVPLLCNVWPPCCGLETTVGLLRQLPQLWCPPLRAVGILVQGDSAASLLAGNFWARNGN